MTAIRVAAGILAVALAPPPAAAEVWEWVEVTQPLLLNGLDLVSTPYLVRVWPYAQEVEMTAWENRMFAGGEWEDRNAARLFGLDVRLLVGDASLPEDSRGKGMSGDTLRVVVDSANARPHEGWPPEMLRRVVASTVDCVYLNAARSSPRPRWVDIRVVGRGDFEDLSCVRELAWDQADR